ncbi:MAG: putative sugar nucleotidyl transferase, partial [Elusimicrobiota bacterium]|nr:putative sugar nucleotidyl transferase [Elusimicrobiota bacterium]
LPLTYTRPVFELRCGMVTLRERITRHYPQETKLTVLCREYLKAVLKQSLPNIEINNIPKEGRCLLINGRLLMTSSIPPLDGPDEIALCGNEIVYIRASASIISTCFSIPVSAQKVIEYLKSKIPVKEVQFNLMHYLWDLIYNNASMIEADFEFYKKPSKIQLPEGVYVVGDKDKLYLGENVRIMPTVVFDTTEGPIYIGDNVKISAHVQIQGPAFVGNKTQLFPGQIWENTSIGENCRVGGEVDGCIFQGYSNKRHSGSLCHAYLGEWINIGGGMTNSDLKNTYGEVKVKIKGTPIKTSKLHLGCFIADHVKTGIVSAIYTGKNIGVAAHVLGSAFEDVPSFTFWAKDLGIPPTELYLDSAIEIEKRTFERRNRQQTQADIDLLKKVYELTAKEREEAKVKKGKIEY